MAIFLRLRFVKSSQNDIIFSNTAITVDIAAKIIKRKNNAGYQKDKRRF